MEATAYGSAPCSRGGQDDVRVPGVGGDGERRLDKYDILVEVSGEGAPAPADGFEAAGLAEAVLRNVARCGYDSPTTVQRYAMPIVMGGRDLMACAQTGSGKTAAFCLPVVNGLVAPPAGGGSGHGYGGGRRDRGSFDRVAKPRALVLAPTRELAAQINEEAKKFCFQTGLRVVVAYGGTPMYNQLRDLERGVDLLVATPGRLVDMVERSRISLEAIEYLVMDEADRMLEMGFEPQIRKIVDMMNMPKKSVRQTMLFSATFPPEVQRLASDLLYNYICVTVGRVGSSTHLIEQKIEFVNDGEKRGYLLADSKLKQASRALPRRGRAAARLPARVWPSRVRHLEEVVLPPTDTPWSPPPPPPYVRSSQESSSHRAHIERNGTILVICFGGFLFAVFVLATALHYYEKWKRSRQPLLSGGPPRGWRLRQLQLQRASTDTSPALATDNSPNYYTAEGELEILSESDEERVVAAHSRSRLEDAQSFAESAAATLATFPTATFQGSCPPSPPPPSPTVRQSVPSTSGRQVRGEIEEVGDDNE